MEEWVDDFEELEKLGENLAIEAADKVGPALQKYAKKHAEL